jgi:hypothetical protein
MIGALILGIVAGGLAHFVIPHDAFEHVEDGSPRPGRLSISFERSPT